MALFDIRTRKCLSEGQIKPKHLPNRNKLHLPYMGRKFGIKIQNIIANANDTEIP